MKQSAITTRRWWVNVLLSVFMVFHPVAAFSDGAGTEGSGRRTSEEDANYVWDPQAKSIFGLLRGLAQAQPENEIETIIEDKIEIYKERLLTLKDHLKKLSGDKAPGAVNTSDGVSIDSLKTEKQEALTEIKNAIERLSQMNLILGSVGSYAPLYKRFITELRNRYDDNRSAGDGLKHLDLFIAYSDWIRTEFEHTTLEFEHHLVQFQTFVSALAKEGSRLVQFLPREFSRNLFPTRTSKTSGASSQTIFGVDMKMSQAAAGVAVCLTALALAAGGINHWWNGDAHDRARNAFRPFPAEQVRGREHENLPSGQEAANRAMQDAADRAAPELMGK